jgi:hypothetical protein
LQMMLPMKLDLRNIINREMCILNISKPSLRRSTTDSGLLVLEVKGETTEASASLNAIP